MVIRGLEFRHNRQPGGQWPERFKEGLHSTLLPVAFEQKGTGFSLPTRDGLNSTARLPDEIRTIVQPPPHAGCRRMQWPATTGQSAAAR